MEVCLTMITETFIVSKDKICDIDYAYCLQSLLNFIPSEFWPKQIKGINLRNISEVSPVIEKSKGDKDNTIVFDVPAPMQLKIYKPLENEVHVTFSYEHAEVGCDVDNVIFNLIADIKSIDDTYRVGIEYDNTNHNKKLY